MIFYVIVAFIATLLSVSSYIEYTQSEFIYKLIFLRLVIGCSLVAVVFILAAAFTALSYM